MVKKHIFSKILASALFFIPLYCQAQEADGGSLAEQATNPIADLVQFQLQNTFIPESFDSSGYSNQYIIQPVVPVKLPFKCLPLLVVRPTLPIIRTPDFDDSPGKRTTALGDLTILGIAIPKSPSWITWGVGSAMIFPTAAHTVTGQGKWQIGPAGVVLVTGVKNWQFGFLGYNLRSDGGVDCDRPKVNTLYFQPIITYHFGEGWYVGTGDLT